MHLAQLRAFVAVVDHGGFTRAGEALGLSQSAVSHAVAGLERALGNSLLDRPRARLSERAVLTVVGRAVIDDARQAVRAADRVAAQAGAAGANLAGELLLGGLPSIDAAVLPEWQRRFTRRHPQVRVTLLEGSDDEVLDWTQRGVVDLGCVAESTGTVAGVLLAEDELVAVLDRDHPLAGAASIAVGELVEDPLITSSSGCEPITEELIRSAGLPFRPQHRVTQLGTILTMVGLGIGVAIMPSLHLSPPPAGVVAVPLRPRLPRRVWLGHRVGERPSGVARAFLDLVAESAGRGGAVTLGG